MSEIDYEDLENAWVTLPSGKRALCYLPAGTLSGNGDAQKITTYAEDGVGRGYGYQIHRRLTIPGSGSLKIALDFSLTTALKLFTLPLMLNTAEGQCFVDTYKITSYSGGTEIPSINRDTTSNNESAAVIKYGITSTDTAGDDLREYIVGTQSAAVWPGGGGITDENMKVFAQDIIVVEIVNQETTDVVFEFNFNWYEPEEGI